MAVMAIHVVVSQFETDRFKLVQELTVDVAELEAHVGVMTRMRGLGLSKKYDGAANDQ